MARSISDIAIEIQSDWGEKTYFGAKPYIAAMLNLDTPSDFYGMDQADDIIRYFLSNAKSWRGETARRVKAELKDLIK